MCLLQTITSTNKNVCGPSLSVSDSLWPPWTVARQAPLSMEFSRQEYWNRLPFPTPTNKNKDVQSINLPSARNFPLSTFQSHLLGNYDFCYHRSCKWNCTVYTQVCITSLMFWTKTYSCCIYHVFTFLYILVIPFYRCMTICTSSAAKYLFSFPLVLSDF